MRVKSHHDRRLFATTTGIPERSKTPVKCHAHAKRRQNRWNLSAESEAAMCREAQGIGCGKPRCVRESGEARRLTPHQDAGMDQTAPFDQLERRRPPFLMQASCERPTRRTNRPGDVSNPERFVRALHAQVQHPSECRRLEATDECPRRLELTMGETRKAPKAVHEFVQIAAVSIAQDLATCADRLEQPNA
jgi:hypothetical protein